jgi:hypothetical protein
LFGERTPAAAPAALGIAYDDLARGADDVARNPV